MRVRTLMSETHISEYPIHNCVFENIPLVITVFQKYRIYNLNFGFH